MKFIRFLLISIVAVALLGVGVAMASTSAHHGHHSGVASAKTAAVPGARFSLLDGARGSADLVDPVLHPDSLPGAASAHRLSLATSNTKAWLTSDGSYVCLAVAGNNGAGTNCTTPSSAATSGVALTIGGGTDTAPVLVVGAVPDGVTSATLTLADGSTKALPVVANGYSALVSQPTKAVAFTTAGSSRTMLPLASYRG